MSKVSVSNGVRSNRRAKPRLISSLTPARRLSAFLSAMPAAIRSCAARHSPVQTGRIRRPNAATRLAGTAVRRPLARGYTDPGIRRPLLGLPARGLLPSGSAGRCAPVQQGCGEANPGSLACLLPLQKRNGQNDFPSSTSAGDFEAKNRIMCVHRPRLVLVQICEQRHSTRHADDGQLRLYNPR